MIKLTQEQKLKKIIERATKNGYGGWSLEAMSYINNAEVSYMMFDHEFAKAFFGEGSLKNIKPAEIVPFNKLGWQYHIQQLALKKESERINYLYSFINEK